jgi:hypothetical protein
MTALYLFGMIALALLLALAAGAASGLKIGAENLGKELAAMMGAFFGPTAVLPAVLIGLAILYFVG